MIHLAIKKKECYGCSISVYQYITCLLQYAIKILQRDVIIKDYVKIACVAKSFFSNMLKQNSLIHLYRLTYLSTINYADYRPKIFHPPIFSSLKPTLCFSISCSLKQEIKCDLVDPKPSKRLHF